MTNLGNEWWVAVSGVCRLVVGGAEWWVMVGAGYWLVVLGGGLVGLLVVDVHWEDPGTNDGHHDASW